jgi:hypothetical protein
MERPTSPGALRSPAISPRHGKLGTFRSSSSSTTVTSVSAPVSTRSPRRRNQDPPHALAGATSECLRRAIRSDRPHRMSRQSLHPQRRPSPLGARDLRRSLQPGEAAPRDRPLASRWATEHQVPLPHLRPYWTKESAWRTDPRVPSGSCIDTRPSPTLAVPRRSEPKVREVGRVSLGQMDSSIDSK